MYLAPEIFRGEPASVLSDIYSLGVLLYHLVTNSYPIPATTVEELQDRLEAGAWVRLRDARPDLPGEFIRVVERAISSDPVRRQSSAGALEHDLEQARAAAKSAGSARRPSPAVAREGEIQSIAVLPFQNMDPDRQLDYFCDGMTEEIINALTRIRNLRVAARDSVFHLKGAAKDVRQIGSILNVQAVLGGSVRASRDRVRIITQLSSVETGHQLWSERFDRTMDDVLDVQDDIARAVVRALRCSLARMHWRRRPPRGMPTPTGSTCRGGITGTSGPKRGSPGASSRSRKRSSSIRGTRRRWSVSRMRTSAWPSMAPGLRTR
jgi:TolB-like protein